MVARLADYTTDVPTGQSLGEIMDLLGDHGAQHVTVAYLTKEPIGIQFEVATPIGPVHYRLVCDMAGVLACLEKVGAEKDRSGKRLIPANRLDDAYARRVGWRILRDWLRAQLAMIQIGMARFEQVMLPYALTGDGRTVYERLQSPEGRRLLLAPPSGEPNPSALNGREL